jgi:DNA invertase Pin-like site-specific DNA recombinase
MARGKFIGYLRVSTEKQGLSVLGIEAQRKAIEDYLNGGGWELLAEYVEIESGKRSDRPELAKALAQSKAWAPPWSSPSSIASRAMSHSFRT